ncbi:MAG: hypothetical protein ACRC18_06495 [Cetobacterium sp.]
MFKQKSKYDVIEMKTSRIGGSLYRNEAIVINLSDYKRSKIEFRTCMTMFELKTKQELYYGYDPHNMFPVCDELFGTFVNNQNIIKDENGALFTVTQLD